MIRRLLLALLLFVFVMAVLVGAAAAWLIVTPSGARWLVNAVIEREPNLHAQLAGGTLWTGLRLEKLSWASSSRAVTLRADSVVLRWRPDCLIQSLVCVDHLAIRGLNVSTAPSPGEARTQPLTLPKIAVPLAVRVGELKLRDARLDAGGKVYALSALTASGSLTGNTLRLGHFAIDMTKPRHFRIEGQGTLQLRGDYPLTASAKLGLPALLNGRDVQAALTLRGSIRRLVVETRLRGAVTLNASGWVEPLLTSPGFDLTLTWSELGWPLDDRGIAALHDGRLRLKGNTKQIVLDGHARLTGAGIPKGELTLTAETDLHRLEIKRLVDKTLGGSLRLQGSVAWGGGLRWQGRLDLAHIDPGLRWPAYRGKLMGTLKGDGKLDHGAWSLNVIVDRLSGSVAGFPASVEGEVHKAEGGPWRFAKVRLRQGKNQVLLSGSVDKSWNMRGRARIDRIEALWPKLKGSATADVKLTGPFKRPTLDVKLLGRSLKYADIAIDGVRVEGRVAALGRSASRLHFSLSGVDASHARFSSVDGTLVGTLAKHSLSLSAKGRPLTASARITGGLSPEGGWSGQVITAQMAAYGQQWALVRPFQVAWLPAGRQARIANNCWAQNAARLCLSAPAPVGRSGTAHLELKNFPLSSLASWMPKGVRWEGAVVADATVGWTPGQRPSVQLTVRSENGAMTLRDNAEATPLTLHYTRIALSAQLAASAADLTLELTSGTLGQAHVDLHIQPGDKPMPIAGEVRVERLRVDPLAPFFPKLQTLSGFVSAKGRLEGTLSAPQFVGQVSLSKGRVVADAMALNLKDIALQANVNGSRATLSGGFTSGGGQAKLTGNADWSSPRWRVALTLKGSKLDFLYPPEVKLKASPDLSLVVVPGKIDLTGRIDIPSADIKLRKLPDQAVPLSEDVVIVNAAHDRAQKRAAAKDLAKWQVNTSIAVVLGDAVKFTGFGLTGRLRGNLNLRQLTGAVPSATGEIRIVDGLYQAYGQKLTIRRGRLLFSGPADQPSLDIEAVRQVNTIVAGIRVTGRPDSPQVSLFSDPTMSQNDILSYLLRGQPASAGGGNKDATLAQAALALGAYGGKDITSALANKLGVKDLTLDTSGNGTQTQFVVGGYLAPKLYLSYGVGVFQPMNTFTLRYTLTRKFYVQATSGLQSAIDIFYTFEF